MPIVTNRGHFHRRRLRSAEGEVQSSLSLASSSPKLVEEVNVEDVVQLRRDHAVPEGVFIERETMTGSDWKRMKNISVEVCHLLALFLS